MSTVLFYYRFLYSDGTEFYKKAKPSAVRLACDHVIIDFLEKVCTLDLKEFPMSCMEVYKDFVAFEKRSDQSEEPLEGDTPIHGLGSKSNPVIIVIPKGILFISDETAESAPKKTDLSSMISSLSLNEVEYGPILTDGVDGIAIEGRHLDRSSLVARVLSDRAQFILLSSPAGTGKTSLLQLITAKSPLKCFHIGLASEKARNALSESLKKLGIDLEEGTAMYDEPRIIMLDDAHRTYGEKSNWTTLVKQVAWKIRTTKFIIAVTHSLEGGTDTPVEFSSFSRIVREEMLLSNEEVHKLLLDEEIGLPIICRDETLVSLITSQCGGIVAAVRLVIREMRTKFRPNRPRQAVEPPMAVQATRFFFSNDITRVMSRCFGSGHKEVPSSLAPLLIRCLHEPIPLAEVDDADGDYIYILIKSGILIRYADEYGFFVKYSGELARRYFYRWLFRHGSSDNPSSLHDLIEKTIAKLSASQLKQSTSSDDDFPKEATFQHLIHGALAWCTESDVSICPEFSKIFPGVDEKIAGEIEFYLGGSLHWVIQILFEGDDVTEHIGRFGPQGKYSQLGVEDYVLVDFRMNATGKVTNITRHSNLITVFFMKGDFTSCKCAFPDGRDVEITLEH